MRKLLIIAGIGLSIFFWQCTKADLNAINIQDTPHEWLSEYHFFNGKLSDLDPAEGVLPYDLLSPLFTDYAHKARFVWMPEGSSASYTTEHALEFPKGAVLIKNFFYYHDERDVSQGRRILETRILLNRGDQWESLSYIWNDEQTDAYLEIIGDIKEVSWIDKNGQEHEINYIIPNTNQCKNCHIYDGKLKPIGPKVRNLNKDYAYQEGALNQLEKWASVGYLTGYDKDQKHPSVVPWDEAAGYTIHDRAMSYLDINCGHCHNPKGAGSTSGLTLLWGTEKGIPLGIYKATVSAGGGTGGHTYSIVPGSPETSILIYRMLSLNPGQMMPELGRSVVHNEGVALVAQWIKEMDIDQSLIPEDASLN